MADALASSRSEPLSVSSQCALEERSGCGTDVPEPRTTRVIIKAEFGSQSPGAGKIKPLSLRIVPLMSRRLQNHGSKRQMLA
jgi:hypothetical protein